MLRLANRFDPWQISIAMAVILPGFWGGIPAVMAADPPTTSPELPSTPANRTLSGDLLLQAYSEAYAALPPLPALQFRQNIRVSGSSEYSATVDMLYRPDGSWQAWLYEGNRARLLDSAHIKMVSQTDIAKLYGTYITDPDAMAVAETWSLNAAPEDYRVESVERVQLGDRFVHHLVLNPLTGGWLRELWLDPERHLPIQAKLSPTTQWGDSSVTLQFGPVDRYWLPQAMQVDLGYRFLSFPGLLQVRSFDGALGLGQGYLVLKIAYVWGCGAQFCLR